MRITGILLTIIALGSMRHSADARLTQIDLYPKGSARATTHHIARASNLEVAESDASLKIAPMALLDVLGGNLAPPLAIESMVYVATGRSIELWDYSDPSRPLLVQRSSVTPGAIQALARHGNYLFASWREGNCHSGGVDVYSIAKRGVIRPAARVKDYAGAVEYTCTGPLVAARGKLYLFDSENGLYVADLATPSRLALLPTGIGHGPAERVAVSDTSLWVGGRTLLGDYALRTFDIGTPNRPRPLASYISASDDIMSTYLTPRYAVGVGYTLSVFDMWKPEAISPTGQARHTSAATTGFRLGHFVYTGGTRGLNVWSVVDPTHPTHLASHDIRTFAARESLSLSRGHALLLGSDDRLVAIDVRSSTQPRLTSEKLRPGGLHVRDVVHVGGYAVLLQRDYGLTIADPRTFRPYARFEPDLPENLGSRNYTAMAVREGIAYLAVWGYGLIIVDLRTPLQPRELGRLPYPGASSIDVTGNFAYLGNSTNGQTLGVVDIGDPKHPILVSDWLMPDTPWGLLTHRNFLFVAEPETGISKGGIRVLDVRDPTSLIQLGRWEGDCGLASDMAMDHLRSLLFVACARGIHILDVSDPRWPRLKGRTETGQEAPTYAAIELHGNRAWYGTGTVVEEYDVSRAYAPKLRRRTGSMFARYEPEQLRITPQGTLLAMTSAGMHVLR